MRLAISRSWESLGCLLDLSLYAHFESAYPFVNSLWVGAAVAKNQAAPFRRFRATSGQGHCRNASLSCVPRDRFVVCARWQQCHQMHPGFGTNHLDRISHMNLDCIHECTSPIHIQHSRPAYMACKVPFSDKIGHGGLIKSRRKDIGGIRSARNADTKSFGTITYPKRRAGNITLLNVPHINNTLRGVQALQ